MLYAKVSHTKALKGNPLDYFTAVADVDNWFMWNINILHASLNSPFEQGARGVAIPALYKITPIQVSKVVGVQHIQFDFIIPLGKVRATYSFKSIEKEKSAVTLSTEIRSFYGWFLFLSKRKKYHTNLKQALEKLELLIIQLK